MSTSQLLFGLGLGWAKSLAEAVYSLFVPSGSDSLITSDAKTFKVREA